ncbi:LysR family transcriptional regulator [Enhygromyxa salina]|uniref:HTH-type transcriptional regulator DmlR n=1 Tax=Enhygromyxa salina TaxID=215803 RepID=A0A2S9YAE7_9BACT|nr:LysR family transcriptional regulator [Enhygromyxa salina]PRQ02088.1 HTH-type transcriptional regulator DmlR [Enhygromyxa salina]
MNWDDCRILLEVDRCGSFLAAGRRLGMSASTVMRRISTLERELGRSVVHRTSHGVQIEAEAHALVEIAAGFEQSLSAHERERAAAIRLSVPDGFGRLAAEAARRCWQQDPTTSVEVSVDSTLVDLAERHADIGLRGGRSTSRVLVQKRVGEISPALFASASYIARHVPSRTLTRAEYPNQHFIGDQHAGRELGPLQWLVARGATVFPFRANTIEARLEAARAGMGIVMYAAGVAPAGLEELVLDAAAPSVPFYVVMHQDLKRVPRMRAMATALTQLFSEHAEAL